MTLFSLKTFCVKLISLYSFVVWWPRQNALLVVFKNHWLELTISFQLIDINAKTNGNLLVDWPDLVQVVQIYQKKDQFKKHWLLYAYDHLLE